MIEEFILNNAQGFVGMLILAYIHYKGIMKLQDKISILDNTLSEHINFCKEHRAELIENGVIEIP